MRFGGGRRGGGGGGFYGGCVYEFLFVCLFVCFPVRLSVCVCLSIYVCLSVCVSVYHVVRLSVCPSVTNLYNHITLVGLYGNLGSSGAPYMTVRSSHALTKQQN